MKGEKGGKWWGGLICDFCVYASFKKNVVKISPLSFADPEAGAGAKKRKKMKKRIDLGKNGGLPFLRCGGKAVLAVFFFSF